MGPTKLRGPRCCSERWRAARADRERRRTAAVGAQDDALYQLFVWVQRAVQSVLFGNGVFGATSIVVPTDRAFGLELLVDLTFQHMIPDLPIEFAQPDPFVTKGQ